MALERTYKCDNCGASTHDPAGGKWLTHWPTLSLCRAPDPLAWFNGKHTCSEDCFWDLAGAWYATRPVRGDAKAKAAA